MEYVCLEEMPDLFEKLAENIKEEVQFHENMSENIEYIFTSLFKKIFLEKEEKEIEEIAFYFLERIVHISEDLVQKKENLDKLLIDFEVD